MKRPSYGERDYAFGQRILTLRTSLGLTQAGLAQRLGVTRRAVGEWEAGSSYPRADQLQHLLELALQQRIFPPGREEEEIRVFWKGAHQKARLDEAWLFSLLQQPSPPPPLVSVEGTDDVEVLTAAPSNGEQPGQPPPSRELLASRAPASSGPRVNWGEALEVSSFYGRKAELATLSQWMVQDLCQVVSVLGVGGIGKSALVTSAMRQAASHFQVVLFRSLRDAPACSVLLEALLQHLAPQPLDVSTANLDRRLNLLLERLRQQRVLLVLDNLETLLQKGDVRGHLRAGYEDYALLLQAVAQRGHQSCLLLTSREKPSELRALEGRNKLVRSLRLAGLDVAAGEQLLASHDLLGSPEERVRLVERYGGNPLALHIVAEAIVDLFADQIAPFLAQDTLVFGSISDLLDEQWSRLSTLEQTLLYWLTILREPVSVQELQAVLLTPLVPGQVLEALDGLQRRSLVERGQRPNSLTLQSVVLEYVTTHLVEQLAEEIVQGPLSLLREYGLSQAQAKDYVRQTQERLLLAPLLARLQSVYQGPDNVEQRLGSLLDEVRPWPQDRQAYAPANLLALLRLLRGDLRGLDLSLLLLRGVYLQGVQMQDASLSGTLLQECVFTETFDAITALAISGSGQYWAAASKRGEVRVWREEGKILQRAWRAHTNFVWGLAFSPDEQTLASRSLDGNLKLWDVESGALLWSDWQTRISSCLAFSPDGGLLASGGVGESLALWDPKLGTLLQEVPHPGPLSALAWSPNGHLLASGDGAGTLRLWVIPPGGPATCVQTLAGHSNWVGGLAFSPDGSRLASGSFDGSLKLWAVESGRCLQTLAGHTQPVTRLAWSPDGRTLASVDGYTIWLWEAQQGRSREALLGHSADVRGLAFTPDSGSLLSGSEDGTLRLWDVEHGEALRVLQGYGASLYDVAWSSDGSQLASAGSDTQVSLWEVTEGGGKRPPKGLGGHEWSVYGVGWSPDGRLLASSGWDNAIRLWEPATGRCLEVIRDLDHPDNVFWGVAWSPDGRFLASGTSLYGVQVWEMTTRSPRLLGRIDPTWIRRIAWSADGGCLVGGGDDGHIYVWDVSDGTLLQRLAGHQGAVMSVAFSPDGSHLASGGGSKDTGELFVWDAHSGERMYVLQGLAGVVYSVAWHPVGDRLLSGGSDGRLRWWDVQNGACLRVREAHQGTVQALKVSPDGIRLASCGDDGAIQIWDLESGEHLRTLRRDRPYERLTITGIRGLTEAQKATLRALGAIEDSALPTPQ